jgi:hypothetical protein
MFDPALALVEPWLTFFSADPILRSLQGGLLLLGSLVIFLIFFTLRDVLLRTESLIYQLFCLLLVTVLPGVGFLLYVLIRPARTLRERETEKMLKELLTKKRSKPKKK